MKYILIALIIIAGGYLAWRSIQTSPDASVPQAVVSDVKENVSPEEKNSNETAPVTNGKMTVDNKNVKISFRGFGPGKEHLGSFSKITSNLSIDEAGAMSGTVIVDMSSLASDNEKLTGHLKSKDFFEVEKYPSATFSLKEISALGTEGLQAKGEMTIRGIKKAVVFPVKFSNNTYSSVFTLNMKDFGINQAFANETVELSVSVPVLKK